MNLQLLSRPIFILTLTFMLYTGCNRKPVRYIYMPPDATLFTNNVPVPELSIVPIDRVNIELRLNTEEIQLAYIKYLPGNTAYALTIKEPTPVALEELEDIRIRPMHRYNSKYSPMDDISDVCTYSYIQSGEDTISKQQVLDGFNTAGRFSFGGNSVYIHIDELPDNNHLQQFIVELITSKNSRLADTTVAFTLTP